MKNLSRKFFLQALSLIVWAFPLSLYSADLEDWTIDAVLEKILEANGGEESLKSATNARFRGEVKSADEAYDFVLLKKRDNKMRIHRNMYKRSVETAFDGKAGWRRFTIDDRTKVIDLEGDELSAMRIQADFDGPLVGPATEEVTRRLVGVERIDRVDYFIVEVTTPVDSSLHFVDSRTFRELKVIKKSTSPSGEPVESVSYFYDIQRHAKIWVAHRVERHKPDGQIEIILINDVEINPGILDLAFAKPE
jgi:hypothetical protein